MLSISIYNIHNTQYTIHNISRTQHDHSIYHLSFDKSTCIAHVQTVHCHVGQSWVVYVFCFFCYIYPFPDVNPYPVQQIECGCIYEMDDSRRCTRRQIDLFALSFQTVQSIHATYTTPNTPITPITYTTPTHNH